MEKLIFKLYVLKDSPQCQQAMATLDEICSNQLKGRCDNTIIDVALDPQAAEDDDVLVTPTLIKIAPSPQRRVLGDFSNAQRLLAALEVDG